MMRILQSMGITLCHGIRPDANAGKCAFWRRRLESQSRSWWLLLTRSRTRSDHVEGGNEWTEGGDRGEDERADGVVPGANRKRGLPAAIGRVNRAVRGTDYRQCGSKRTTTATPAGRIGNDVPITDTHEVWTSNAMKLVLLQKWMEPRTGVRIKHLADFSRAKPNAVLFSPRLAMNDLDELRGRVPPKRDSGAVILQIECCSSGSATLSK